MLEINTILILLFLWCTGNFILIVIMLRSIDNSLCGMAARLASFKYSTDKNIMEIERLYLKLVDKTSQDINQPRERRPYRLFTLNQKAKIEILLKKGYKTTAIATMMKVEISRISSFKYRMRKRDKKS